MIVDGKHIAQEVLHKLVEERKRFGMLTLGILMGAGDAATDSFVAIKARIAKRLGVELSRIELGETADTAEAVFALKELVKNTQGIIVQLPLPERIDLAAVLDALPESHDVDALKSDRLVRPPVAEAIAEIFSVHNVTAAQKYAVVLGAGRLVGTPAAALLRDLGAEVSVISKTAGSFNDLKNADIVVSGAGEPGLIKLPMLKEGVILIDAGTSEGDNRIVGDADPECAKVASLFTPVPGGVGPIAVAMLFKNLLTLVKSHKQ